MGSERRLSVLFLLSTLAGAGCAADVRRFPLADPLWIDPDMNTVPTRPAGYYSGLQADGADQMVLRPLAELFAVNDPGEAINVNALDEVPNSSWFTNRIGYFPRSLEEVARGACGSTIDTAGPWTVVEAKPNGFNPGFFIKTASGQRYLLKADGIVQPERNTAADVIGSKLFHAAGFDTPCYQIAYFDPSILKVDPEAVAEDEYGEDRPLTQADLDYVLGACTKTKGGLIRAGFSEFVKGKPLGPFRYEGVRRDDPNDVVPHADRRELRGAKVLAAWLGHFDSREQNSLNVWTKRDGREFVQHYYIDFGSSFGSRWPIDALSRRMGYSYYFDPRDILVDLFSLGLVRRPWDYAEINPGSEIFGYFESEQLRVTEWKGGYPNPAFERATLRDLSWMARIIARFTPEHLAAAVAQAKFSDPRAERWLIETLLARRQRIFEEVFTKSSPLDEFQLVRRTPGSPTQSLCFEDLAVKFGVVDPTKVVYKLRMMGGPALQDRLGWHQFAPDEAHPQRACVVLPVGFKRPSELVPADAPDDHPLRYGVLRIYVHQAFTFLPASQLDLHFYDRGRERGFVLVGIERPERPRVPSDY
jgi:hypothetical protein